MVSQARVNMDPMELPQREGLLPQYAQHKLLELQVKLDQLGELGVFRHPEDFKISVEYFSHPFW